MLRVFRVLLVLVGALGGVAALGATARAADSAGVAAIAAARAGDWGKAYAEARQSRDALAVKVVQWLDYTRSSPDGKFAEIAGFIDQNPEWPLQKTLRRRAESALASESDDTAAKWLERHPPVSGAGKMRAAQILIDQGKTAAGMAGVRAAWRDGDFTLTDERGILARFSAMLRPEDHWQRLDRLLWDGETDAARRMLPLVSADYQVLAEARLALAANSPTFNKLLAKLPARLHTDPGLAFEEARWQRKRGNYDAAAGLLLGHPNNPVRPAAWWSERLIVARQLLAGGNPRLAYRLVAHEASSDETAYARAEFLCGYIALRFRKDPALAFDHFSHVLARVTSPYARARAAYWAGRAAQAAGKPDLATKWFTAGADNIATFYGQLSAHQLGRDAPPHPVPEPRPSSYEQARFNGRELVRAATLFLAAGDREHAKTFLLAMAHLAKRPLDFAMLASLAESYGRVDLAIVVAQRAVAAGMPLMVHGYPVTALPRGEGAERPLLLAVVRQESAFAPDATSRAGARGLMQLMPATARGVAGKLQLPFSLDRLTSDGMYNVTLGRSYLDKLIADFGGSYALAIAAYNAGPGRVRQWLHEFGDPRGHDIGMVDWIEMIPFGETRAYVQRVLENLQVYRGQSNNNAAAFSLVADLAR